VTATRHSPRIFVTVGTHEQGFARLLTAVADVAQLWTTNGIDVDWLVQTGPAAVPLPETVRHFGSCSHDEIVASLKWADFTVSGCSPGSVFWAIACQAWPIVVPRLSKFGEHVDDHQLAFADYLEAHGMATVVPDVSSLDSALRAAMSESRHARIAKLNRLEAASHGRTEQWTRLFGAEVESLVGRQRSRRRTRRAV